MLCTLGHVCSGSPNYMLVELHPHGIFGLQQCCTSRVWPMRCDRAMACSSFLGFGSGS